MRKESVVHEVYRIHLIRHWGYYLFHQSILYGFYSRVATIRERHSFSSEKSLVNTCAEGWEFYNVNNKLTCSDLVSEQNLQRQLEVLQQSSTYTWHLQSVSLFASAK